MTRRGSARLPVVAGLLVAVGLVLAVAPFASSSPDGLEKVAEEQGFADRAVTSGAQEGAPVRDYALPGVEDEKAATGLGGLVGVLVVFALALAVGAVIRRRPWERSAPTASS